jgi:hypothetical protein
VKSGSDAQQLNLVFGQSAKPPEVYRDGHDAFAVQARVGIALTERHRKRFGISN